MSLIYYLFEPIWSEVKKDGRYRSEMNGIREFYEGTTDVFTRVENSAG